jgi:SAM-dependent methyltransferase
MSAPVPTAALLPRSSDDFRSREYWEGFFAARERAGGAFEWYGEWSDVAPVLLPRLPAGSPARSRVLVVGCGNSALSADMHSAGFATVHSIDFSDTVIERMRAAHAGRPGLVWDVMDATAMTFPDGSFDLVVDKVYRMGRRCCCCRRRRRCHHATTLVYWLNAVCCGGLRPGVSRCLVGGGGR